MPKPQDEEPTPAAAAKSTLGPAPAVLAKRENLKPNFWCFKQDIEFDRSCDANNPKTIAFNEIAKAATAIRGVVGETPLLRAKNCKHINMELYYKNEIGHRTGSFHERGAAYALQMLTPEQQQAGVITASTGNWAVALSYHGQQLGVGVTVVLPQPTHMAVAERCDEYGAGVVLHGDHLAAAKRHAFQLAHERGVSYLNGYDHPHVIAAAGSIGKEIMEQLPGTDAILVPIGGGALIAGVAVAAKQMKPDIVIIGVESDKSCSFFKAMENEFPYQTAVQSGLAGALAVPTAGYNAFYTARSLIDKMILIGDDWIARAILHLVEDEHLVVEGAGAAGLGALMALPQVLPELQGKTVVTLLTGGNIDVTTFRKSLDRAKVAEGRIIKLTVTLPADDTRQQMLVLSIISNVGCNVLKCVTEKAWTTSDNFYSIYLTLFVETVGLEHACRLKRVMDRLFPDMCDFLEEPFSPIPMCMCYPNKRV